MQGTIPKTISYKQTGPPKARAAALSVSCFKGVGSQSSEEQTALNPLQG